MIIDTLIVKSTIQYFKLLNFVEKSNWNTDCLSLNHHKEVLIIIINTCITGLNDDSSSTRSDLHLLELVQLYGLL